MRIGIYGGTFDPPHLGHSSAAKAAAEALELDRLLLVPAKVPPHKRLSENSASPEQRLEMTRILADGLLPQGRAQADDLELAREGMSYTSDTLREMKARYPDDELWLLMGTDMFMTLQDWHEPEVILSLAGVAAFRRSGEDSPQAMEAQAARLREDFGARVRLVELPQIREVSSTQVRQALAKGEAPEVPLPVYGYILRDQLYGTNADLKRLTDDELRACSLSMVYAKRHAHILGVEKTAVELAERWGADPELARRAGILHDCTKYLNLEEQLQICRKYGIVLDDLERESAKLLHSKAGAALARYVYGQPEEVYWAIFWHTTGKADMSLLEKIVYLADYMEPNRDFDGVDKLRKLCYTDLDAALALGLDMSIADLTERGVPIHKNTQGARDWLTRHGKG